MAPLRAPGVRIRRGVRCRTPAFDAGLTDAAPDLQIGVGLSLRF